MLILNFIDEREVADKPRRWIKKKVKNREFKRYSINVNGKTVTVLNLQKEDLGNEDVLTLLKIYKGRTLVSEKFKNEERIKEYLFNPNAYYQRALLSSLINQIKTVNKDWKNICVRIDEFVVFKELYELVRISKKLNIVTRNNAVSERFLNDCYYEYGTMVNIKNEASVQDDEIFLNLNNIDKNGKLMINVKGKEYLLYPDTRYFDNCVEYQKLSQFNIEHKIICSAFSNK